MKKNKLIAIAALLFHVMTFSVPQGLAADGWVVMDNDGNVISQNDGNTTNVNVVDGNSYTVVNGDIALDQIINVNVLNSLGIADAGAKAVFNFNDGQASVWEGVLNLVGTAAFINAMGFDVAASFEGNVSGGAILSSLGINEAQFFAGIAELARGVNDPAAVINNGTWNVDPQSFLALVGSAVHNLGQINANGGAAVLAAGDKVTLDLTGGNGLISVAVDQAINAPVYDKNGNKISDVISNSGVIRANGGLAVLSAKAAESLFDNIVNHSGIIEANSISSVNGRIILDGGNEGVTNVTGILNAQGDNLGEKGGTVHVLGKKVGLFNNALVNVSGFAGGGTALIGGDYQGLGSVHNADATYIGQGVTIKADALDEGDGGKVIVWADNTTRAYGTISAKGGAVSGNGGFIETSGKEYLDVDGAQIDASAANGSAGTWLLDPRSVDVVSTLTNPANKQHGAFGALGGGPGDWYPDHSASTSEKSQILNTQINAHLDAGTNVTISSFNSGSGNPNDSNGDISILAPISKTAGGDAQLKLTTDPYTPNIQNININAAVTSTAGKLNIVLFANGVVNFAAAAVVDTFGGSLQIGSASVTQAAGSSIKAGTLDVTTSSGGISLNQAGNQFSNLYIDALTNGNIDIADSGTPTAITQMMTNGGSINYAHTGSGDVTVGAGSTVRTNNGASAGGNITMNTSHGLSFDAASVVKTSDTGGGTVNVTGATVLTTPIAGAGTTITLNGGAPDTVIDFTISGAVSQSTNYVITALRDILGQATVTTTGGASVSMTADSDLDGDGGIWIESAGGINSSGDVTLVGSAINKAGAGNGLSVYIENDGANRQIEAAGDINLLSSSAVVPAGKGGISVQGIVETTGVGKTINIDSKAAVVTNNSGPMLIGDNVTIKSVGGTNVKVDADNLSYNNSGGGTVAIEDFAGGLTITGASNVGGLALSIVTHSPLTIAADIIQAAAISLSAGEAAGAGDDLTINAGVTVNATGAGSDVTLNAGDNVVLGAASIVKSDTAAVSITAGFGDTDTAGNITSAGTVNAATTATLSASQGSITQSAGSILATDLVVNALSSSSLNQATNDVNTLAATTTNGLTFRDADNLDLKASTIGGAFDLTTGGAITDSGNLSVTGATTLVAGAGNDITLNNTNNFSSVKVTSGKDVTLNDSGAISLDNSTISGLLSVTAGGLIDFVGNAATTVATTMNLTTTTTGINDSGTGSLAVTGVTTLNSGVTDVTLNNANNDFSSVVVTAANNVTLRDVNAINFDTSTLSGNLDVTAGGNITDSGNLTVTNNAAFNAGANDITIGDADTANFGSLTFNGGAVSVKEGSAVVVTGTNTANSLYLESNGAIADANGTSLNVTNNAQFNAGANDITIGDDAGDTTNFGSVVLTGGNVAVTEDSAMVINGVGASSLNLKANGTITDNSNNIVVTGTTTLDAGANDITLNNVNEFNSVIVTAASNAEINDTTGDLNIGASNLTGNLKVTTTGAITDSGNITASGLEFSAGTTVTLDQAANDFNNVAGTSNGTILITDVDDLNVTTVGAKNGLNSTNNNITLNATNITLTQAVNAGSGDATLNASGYIREGVADDGAPVADVIGKNIFLNSQVAAPGDALGQSASYLDLQVTNTATGSWNVSVPNSGNVYINCIGDCPIGQVDVGTATFNHSSSGAILDGNDDLVGEFNGATWNIKAGGINIKTGTGFGTLTDTIELRLAGFAGVLTDAGRMAVDGGTGGVFATNLNSLNAAGLAIGGIAGSFVNGIQAQAGIGIGSGSPLAVNADVNDTGGGDIYLAALGTAATDDLTINANISATGGNGDIALLAGDSVVMNAGTTASVAGTGVINVLAGEDGTDLTVDQDGNASGSISMNATASLVSAGGTITLDARNGIAAGLVNAGAGIVSLFARAGAVTDANAATNNITADSVTATAATGIDLDTTITTLTNANVTGTGAIDINDLAGGLAVTSATTNDGAITINATGGNLDATTVTAAGTSRDVSLSTTTSGNVNVGNVTAAGDNIAITSAGNIEELGADGAADLTSGTMNLTSATGIGSAAQLEIDATTLTNASVSGTGAINLTDLAGGLAVTSATTADGQITINATGGNLDVTTVTAVGTSRDVTLSTTTSGNVNVGNVTAAGDNIAITSVGNIEELGADGAADLTSATMNLTSATGVGNAAQIEIDATTLTNASVSGIGAISLTDLAGGLAVTSATTADGQITINATGGNLDLTTVTAGGTGRNVNLTTTTSGNINLGNVTASGDTVNVTSVGAIRGMTDDGVADVSAGTINLIAAVGGISGAAGIGGLDVTATTALNADTAAGDDSNITIDSIGNLPIGLVNAGAGIVTLVSTGNMTDVNDVTADAPAVTNIIGSTINLVAMVGGIGTVGNAVDFLASTQFNADTVTGDDSDINVRSTGNAPVGLIDAGTGDVKLTSEGNITDANDGGTPDAPGVLNINGGQIDLITVNGNDIGQFVNYFEIQPSTLWNVTTNGGDAYIACVGLCPLGQADLGTGLFYYAGNITDGNDIVNGEIAGGTWNIRAGGLHSDADNTVAGFIGASNNWIETRLAYDANNDTTIDSNGLLVATAGTGGVHISNDVPGNAALGLNIGFAAEASSITGITSTGGIEIYSFSPLVVAANVTDNSANSIDLVAVGNSGVDDLTVQTGVTVQQLGSGNINLFAGDDIQLQGTALVQSTTGVINAGAGENRTGDLITDAFEGDGTAGGSIVMAANSAFRSNDAAINLTANNHLRISEVNANSNNDGTLGNVNLIADFNANGVGRIEDRNGANALNVTGDALTMRAGSGIGVDAANAIDAIETSVNTVDLINSTSGHVAVTEVAAGGNLDILRANQNAPVDTMTIKTLDGDLKVVGAANGGFGVTTQAGELLLEANGAGANDDLIVNNTVTSTTGKINLDSTSRDVRFNANGDVTATTGAEIEVNAFRDIVMADGTVLNANAGGAQGGIDLDAGRDITLGSVQTTSALSVDRNADAFDAVQIDAAAGAVIDGGDTDDDIIAQSGQTTINAVTGIGSADQLDTQIHSLKALNATSGDIRIREVIAGGNLDLIGVTQSAVTGALNIRTLDGSLTVLAVGLGGLGVSAIDGVTRLFARDNDASGADHLVINHTVRSADGKINLDSENDVIASAAGDVTAGDTTLKVGATGAEIEVDAIDNITMADGTIFNANAGGPQGGIDMDAQNGNITLGSVQTSNASNNAVTIHTESGAIIDGGDIDRDIVNTGGGGVILSAQTGIGSRGTGLNLVPNPVLDNFAPDAIDMTGAGTRLSAFTESGDIQVQNIGALEITTLSDNDGGTPLGSAGAGTVTGVQINDPALLDPNSIIFITAGSPITVNSVIRNFDGGNVSVYALGATPADTMTINADIQSIGGNGDVRVVSGSSMTMAPNVSISTQGDGVTSGTGRIAVGAGYDATAKAADEAFVPGTTLFNSSASLFDTAGDAGANLTMDELSRIWSEDGNILVDVQNVFTVGRVDADGNNDANGATSSGLTDGVRGDITTFSRNGSTLDAEPSDVGNLDFLANVLTMFSGDNIGLSTNHIEIDAPIFNAFAINNIFVDGLGNVLANMFSDTGSIAFTATGDILLGTAHAAKGGVSLTAGGSILSQGGSDIRIIANTPIALTAGGVIGTLANAINTQLNGAGVLLINAGSAINGISSNVTGNFTPLGIQVLNAPGLVLFNGLAVGGDSLSTLKTSIASLFQGVLPQILGQFGRFNGNVSPDFPGLAKLSEFGHVAEAPMDTTGVDSIGLPGVPAPAAEQRRPAAQPQQIPAPVVPQQQQPTTAPAVQTTTITPADATTPPAVVPIPDDAAPTEQELNVENQNRN